MKLGISSYTYSWSVGVRGYPPPDPLTAMGLLDKAASMGIHVVQIADNLPLDQLSDSELDALAQHAEDLKIDIEVGTNGIAHGHLHTYIRLAERLKSSILRLVVDTAEHHPSADEVINTVSAVIPEFERANVCLAIENHDRFLSKVLKHILESVGSKHLGICLDTANSFGAMEGPDIVLGTLAPWIVNLHVKDFTIYRASHNLGLIIEGRPAGQGMLDIPWLLGELRSYDHDPNAILELWTPPEEKLEDTIAKELKWAADSVEYLRQLIPG
jgi:3-oxoisoapionate decarboxylase